MSLRFFAGGGQPPQSHEVLLVEVGGEGWYLTGMPWPEQPPFDEIGAYRVELGAAGYQRLAALARAVIADPEPPAGSADAGGESVRLDDEQASWGARERSAGAQALVGAAREAIAAARERPHAVVRAELAGSHVALSNRGDHPLPVAGGELRAGWGPSDHAPSPLRLAAAEPVAVTLPAELAPGEALTFPLPAAVPDGDEEFTVPYALVSLRWRPEVPGEREELDGWMIAGGG
ncbi:MAG: hypothetical protein ABI611_03830 [Solirubrobacteraceae bacterium]